jgi:heme A synthase
MAQYRCQLERLGAPHWACGVGGMILALAIVVTVVFITVLLWGKPGTPGWALPLFWSLGALGLALAVRSSLGAFRHHSEAGATGSDGPAPSNNRWRGP